MAYTKKEREIYNQRRERTSQELGLDKYKYNAFRRIANRISEADTKSANGYEGKEAKWQGNKLLNEYGEKHWKNETRPNFKKAHEMAKKMGLHIYHQSDPRGPSLYLGKKRMSQKDYNSKGKVIY